MKKVYVIGLNFRLCSLTEAEELACEKILSDGPDWVAPTTHSHQPDLAFPPKLIYSSSIPPDPSITTKKLTIDLTPRKTDGLLRLKEFYDCFSDCEEKKVSGKVFKEIDSLFLDEQHPDSPFSPSPLFNPSSAAVMAINYRLQQKTLDALDSAVGSIYDRGAWVEDYVNLFIVRRNIIIFVGKPIVYAQTQPSGPYGKVKFGFGYTMIRPEACVKLTKK